MAQFVTRYNARWSAMLHPLELEIKCIQNGGRWKKKGGGGEAGEGLFYHYKKGMQILWPEDGWHKWRDLRLKTYLDHSYIGEMGCAASGKSHDAAAFVLFDWYCFPHCTTVLVSSTDLQSLDLRIFGIIKNKHRRAREAYGWLPGYLIEGKRMITLNARDDYESGRDFRNGIIGVPTKKGSTYVGLSPLLGIHNKRIRLIGDELQLMPRAFLDAVSNLSKCEDFKMGGLGNPNDISNAHGILCEPEQGWETGLDQKSKTTSWKTKFPNGICLQFPGPDCPNMDVGEDEPVPFPFLITRKQMDEDARMWGVDDWHFTMMNLARMPRGQGSRRIITRQSCEKFHALDEPVWRDTRRTKIACLDAAYRGVGGDRCVFAEMQFGLQAEMITETALTDSAMGSWQRGYASGTTILALIDIMIVPLTSDKISESPEDQIVKFVTGECERRGIPPKNFFFDAGMKTSLVSAFSRMWSPDVQSIDFGGKPTERMVSGGIDVSCKDYYFNFVTELWYSLRLTIEAGQFRGLTRDAMWEASTREWRHHPGTNKIQAETKPEMKLKSGKSPDLVDCIVTGLEGARRLGFQIQRIENKDEKWTDPSWKKKLREQSRAYWKSGQLDYAA